MLTNILLDVGTNEVEIASLTIAGARYGLNAAKVREIIPLAQAEVTPVPGSAPAFRGVLLHREDALPLIDLGVLLGNESRDPRVAVIIQVNLVRCAVLCSSMDRIHRMSWESLKPLGDLAQYGSPLTGTVEIGDELLLLLDIETLIAQLFPEAGMASQTLESTDGMRLARSAHRIFVADDSPWIRKTVCDLLVQSGYRIRDFVNGLEAWNAIVREGDRPSVMLTDIEMPQLDGLTLCRRLKEREDTADIPVILFSSLLEKQTDSRGDRVGADAMLAKPQLREVVFEVDRLLKITEPEPVA